jgi:hypothetical protein
MAQEAIFNSRKVNRGEFQKKKHEMAVGRD